MRRDLISHVLAAAAGLACAYHAAAQSYYAESFSNVGDGSSGSGGPATLISRGWVFRNQSTNIGIRVGHSARGP
jgi:hypothetical protein